MTKIIITSLSSSSTGKTTNFAQIAYFVASAGYQVRVIELDTRNSLRACCGLGDIAPQKSTSVIFQDSFTGNYPFIPLWEKHLKGKAQILQADRDDFKKVISELIKQGETNPLRKIFEKYPIDCDLLILDCPGQSDLMTDSAMMESSHLIFGIKVSDKCFNDVSYFLKYLYGLKEKHKFSLPIISGFLVGIYETKHSYQREGLEQLLEQAKQLGCHLFNPIRYSAYFENSYSAGLPLKIYAPHFAANQDYTIDGNFFKRDIKSLVGFSEEFKELTAIVPYLISKIKK